jgi:hypothetical protein
VEKAMGAVAKLCVDHDRRRQTPGLMPECL